LAWLSIKKVRNTYVPFINYYFKGIVNLSTSKSNLTLTNFGDLYDIRERHKTSLKKRNSGYSNESPIAAISEFKTVNSTIIKGESQAELKAEFSLMDYGRLKSFSI
jgi:hypothetical protein